MLHDDTHGQIRRLPRGQGRDGKKWSGRYGNGTRTGMVRELESVRYFTPARDFRTFPFLNSVPTSPVLPQHKLLTRVFPYPPLSAQLISHPMAVFGTLSPVPNPTVCPLNAIP